MPIKSFKHKGLQQYFISEPKAGIQAAHASKLKRLLARLNASTKPEDMNLPGFGFHGLSGQQTGRYAVSVNGNWRVTFEFDGIDAVVVDYEDYH